MRLEDRLDQIIEIECGPGCGTRLLTYEFLHRPERLLVLLECDADIDWRDLPERKDLDEDIDEDRTTVAIWYEVVPDSSKKHGYRLVADEV